ncbi:uncharacterized protein LOC5510029 isoform X2 [Nematostella vectensis]|uniref:uncharacterized protein LOC5510029 isoform X2 n=1 Tax=Nematostella vectensis TaxID=45351 RepID=UPI002076F51F|nr:uncharacterized protein LOC5510029 isoform X2 [Nematostella vectensis]
MMKSMNRSRLQTPPRYGHSPADTMGVPSADKHNRSNKTSDYLLTNILEETSSVDDLGDFEQEERYLNECLRAANGSTEDVQYSEVEEYDFDDFNSIASTASLLNLNHPPDNPRTRAFPPKPFAVIPHPNGTVVHPHPQGDQYLNGHVSAYQKSISKVESWDQLGCMASQDDWREVLLRASEAGDLITVQNAVSHLGTSRECLVHTRDVTGCTPLHRAAHGGKLKCLQWLVKHAPAHALAIENSDGRTPAAMATQSGHQECLSWLLESTEARAELEKKNSFTLLHYAAQAGQQECLKYLLTALRGANRSIAITDSNGVTPEHLAAREGHLLCLQTLVDFNADVTVKDKDGWTAADYAFKAGHTGCAKYLAMVESCFVLSERVGVLTRELNSCRQENAELRRRLDVLEDRSRMSMPCRPEAVGGDQSDTSSTASASSAHYIGFSPPCHRQTHGGVGLRTESSPDGESPKNTDIDGEMYDFSTHAPLRAKRSTSLRRHSIPNNLHQSSSANSTSSRPGSAHGDAKQTDESRQRALPAMPPQRTTSAKKSPPLPPTRFSSISRENTVSRENPATHMSHPSVPLGHDVHPGIHPNDNLKDSSRRSSSTTDDDSRRSSRSQSPHRTTGMPVGTDTSGRPLPNVQRIVTSAVSSSNKIRPMTVFSSESPFSSDSDFEHTYDRQTPSRYKQASADRPQRRRDSDDRQARYSWHGVTSPSRGTSNRVPQAQQAHIVRNDSIPRIVTDVKSLGPTIARTKSLSSTSSFASFNHEDEEKPWYEADDEV